MKTPQFDEADATTMRLVAAKAFPLFEWDAQATGTRLMLVVRYGNDKITAVWDAAHPAPVERAKALKAYNDAGSHSDFVNVFATHASQELAKAMELWLAPIEHPVFTREQADHAAEIARDAYPEYEWQGKISNSTHGIMLEARDGETVLHAKWASDEGERQQQKNSDGIYRQFPTHELFLDWFTQSAIDTLIRMLRNPAEES